MTAKGAGHNEDPTGRMGIWKTTRLTYTLSKQDFDNPSDAENMSIQFSVITEYVDPNYENVYPAEYTKPLDPISLKANFGETY